MSIGDRLIRWAAVLSVLIVAGIAAVISYGHAYHLVLANGESGATARAVPLTVDGLIVMCSLLLLHAARRGQRAPTLAWLLLACGIVATLGANIAHGIAHGPVGAVIAGWPALVAVGSFELLARLIRDGRRDHTEETRTQGPGPYGPYGTHEDDRTVGAIPDGSAPYTRQDRTEPPVRNTPYTDDGQTRTGHTSEALTGDAPQVGQDRKDGHPPYGPYRDGEQARTGRTAPVSPLIPRTEVVWTLVREIRTTAAEGRTWRPDYVLLMKTTSRSRSWCEKAVREARTEAARTDRTEPAQMYG